MGSSRRHASSRSDGDEGTAVTNGLQEAHNGRKDGDGDTFVNGDSAPAYDDDDESRKRKRRRRRGDESDHSEYEDNNDGSRSGDDVTMSGGKREGEENDKVSDGTNSKTNADENGDGSRRRHSNSNSRGSRRRNRRRRNSHSNNDRDNNVETRDGVNSNSDVATSTVTMTDKDVAFVVGKGGSTKRKIERVSGASLNLEQGSTVLEIRGTEEERARAEEYTQFVLNQRTGKVFIDFDVTRDDCSVIEVPRSTVGYIMGAGGRGLRRLEEEWGTLMFFAKHKTQSDSDAGVDNNVAQKETEKLAIFGRRRGRRGAELKVMSSVEHKEAGFFIDTKVEAENVCLFNELKQPGDGDGDWGYDTKVLADSEYSYALGQNGMTRKKLAAASGSILEFVGMIAVAAGTRAERERALQYLTWLLQQKDGKKISIDVSERSDIDVVEIPEDAMGFVTGQRGSSLRRIEADTKTFCFSDGTSKAKSEKSNTDGASANDDGEAKKKTESIMVFGASKGGRSRACNIIMDMVKQREGLSRRGGGGGSRGGDRRGRNRRDSYHQDRDYSRGDNGGRSRDYDRDRSDGRYHRRDTYSSSRDDDRRRDRSRSRERSGTYRRDRDGYSRNRDENRSNRDYRDDHRDERDSRDRNRDRRYGRDSHSSSRSRDDDRRRDRGGDGDGDRYHNRRGNDSHSNGDRYKDRDGYRR